MKFIKILNYVENSYQGKPSFIILMSDNKEYISNGCVFTENTLENVKELINKYDCEEYLNELFKAPPIHIKDLVEGYGMFWNSPITEFEVDLSNLEDGRYMFACTNLTEFKGDLPKLKYGRYMFCDTNLTEFEGNLPNLVNGVGMFYKANLAKFKVDLPKLTQGKYMFYNTPYEFSKQ